MIGRILEITFVLVLIYLVLSRAFDFSQAINAIGSVYVQSVRALQGR